MRKLFALALLALAASCGAPQAPTAQQEAPAGALEVREAWAAATPGGAEVAAGYLTVINGTSADDRLMSVTSPRAVSVEIHEMSMEGDVMRMRAVEGGLAIPAGESVALAPGGMHIMFVGVTAPFVEGEDIPVTLTFETAGAFEVSLPVRAGMTHGGEH
jgi:periplasmic copper chaperone A